jgi:beta-glucosidase
MIVIYTICMVFLLIAFALVLNALLYMRLSVKPADFPWLQSAKNYSPKQLANRLLNEMTPGEKLDQLSGDGGIRSLLRLAISFKLLKRMPNMYSGFNARLQLPPLSFTDGPRGVVIGQCTSFPVAMARGATWDISLERRVADVFGREARAVGANYFGGVCVNLLRYPQWGRAQETFGEDPHHVGEMGAADVAGVQHHNVMACVKHFAVNNIENSRFYVDVKVDMKTLHEVYLPHFKRCVDAGAASIMSAYNQVNGDYCGHQRWLLEDILRKQWGFSGFVSSDWMWGVYDTVKGINAGMDVEMPIARVYRRKKIQAALQSSDIGAERIDEIVNRVLATRLEFAMRPDPENYDSSVVSCGAHVALAQETAEKSMVLLQNNDKCLPFQSSMRIAVIGELADTLNLGDYGSSRTRPKSVVTFLQGLQTHYGVQQIVYCDGKNPAEAARVASSCDAALIVAGRYPDDEGENVLSNQKPPKEIPEKTKGGDRTDLSLASNQVAMICAVGKAQSRSAVCLVGGSAIFTDPWRNDVGAVFMAWYPGMCGGTALARLISGEIDFAGRLPFTWPTSQNRLGAFDAYASSAEYSYYHGYTWFDHTQQKPAYPFGFGLSYGPAIEYSELVSEIPGDEINVQVTLSNSDTRPRREVVQVYIGAPNEFAERHRKNLKAFQVIELEPGEKRHVTLTILVEKLGRYCTEATRWLVDSGEYQLWVGPNSDDLQCQHSVLTLDLGP